MKHPETWHDKTDETEDKQYDFDITDVLKQKESSEFRFIRGLFDSSNLEHEDSDSQHIENREAKPFHKEEDKKDVEIDHTNSLYFNIFELEKDVSNKDAQRVVQPQEALENQFAKIRIERLKLEYKNLADCIENKKPHWLIQPKSKIMRKEGVSFISVDDLLSFIEEFLPLCNYRHKTSNFIKKILEIKNIVDEHTGKVLSCVNIRVLNASVWDEICAFISEEKSDLFGFQSTGATSISDNIFGNVEFPTATLENKLTKCSGLSQSNIFDFENASLCQPEKATAERRRNKVKCASANDLNRPFVCEHGMCRRAFKRYEHLKRHMLMHTGERPYKCSFPGCNRSFSRSDNLTAHYKIHGSDYSFMPRQNKYGP
ncbi:hypothetical protein ENBRE01_1435 [Enteropsectra breve]|nr:hypothetical protein ENBRE01_1435 [Enteropsectra breve]